jgi:cytochrome c-type biogenesis protein CcmF
MAIALSVLVVATVASEFIRGGRVISRHTGMNLLSAMVHLTRRNTRRYGGYIVHFGVVVIIIGFAGAAFNRENEQPLGAGDKMSVGSYTLVGRSYTQDDNPNYSSESAIIDVFRGGRQVGTMYPERRFYKASQQAATIVANRSTYKEDLYLVYAGRPEENGPPIIKAHLNPLVMWIWVGVYVVIFGTLVALVPSRAAVTVPQPARARAAAVEVGD